MKELSDRERGKFKLDWRTLPVDIIWDRVYSKFLNTWLVFIAMMLMLTLVAGNWIDNPFPERASSWMGDVVVYQLLLIVGTVATAVISPFMYANGHDQFRKPLSRVLLTFFPLGCAAIFTTFWVYKRHNSHELFPLFFWLSSLTGCCCCAFYFMHISYTASSDKSYMEKHQNRNVLYVRRLLRPHPHSSTGVTAAFGLHSARETLPLLPVPVPGYMLQEGTEAVAATVGVGWEGGREGAADGGSESAREDGLMQHIRANTTHKDQASQEQQTQEQTDPLNLIPTEQSLASFFVSLWTCPEPILVDVKKNTPQLMILGTVLGAMVAGYIVGWTFKNLFVTTKWEYVYDKFEDATADVSAYIDSAYDLQASITAVNDAKIFSYNASSVNATLNKTYAVEQIDFYLQQLGYDVTLADMQELSAAVTNLTATAETTSAYFYDLSSAYSDFKSRVRGYKDEYNELKWSWNCSIILASAIATLTSLASMAWPLLVASNTRHNLRTGKWRYNKKAYCVKYKVHTLTEVPGMIFGIAAISHIMLFLVLSVVFFTIIYWPIREFIWDTFKKYIVSLICAIAFKNFLVYLLFNRWQLDTHGRIKDIQSYSIVFIIILFFNVVYGVLAATIRLLIFFAFSFVCNLRIDATMLPLPFWQLDSAFSGYNSYLLYEHEHKNPIMRTALEIIAGSYGYASVVTQDKAEPIFLSNQQIRARNRWFLAYTLIHNPLLIPLRRKRAPVTVPEDGVGGRDKTGSQPSPVGEKDLESGAASLTVINEDEGNNDGIIMSELHKTR